jgi:hypothetical protein
MAIDGNMSTDFTSLGIMYYEEPGDEYTHNITINSLLLLLSLSLSLSLSLIYNNCVYIYIHLYIVMIYMLNCYLYPL